MTTLTETYSTEVSPMEIARAAAKYLKDEYGATRVLLFGSLARGDYDPRYSDIDIYFEGVPRAKVDEAAGMAMWHFPKHDIEFCADARCSEDLLKTIHETGIPL